MKIKNRIIITALLAAVCMGSFNNIHAIPVSAADAELTVKVDGTVVDFPDQAPTIRNDRTLVPVRFIAEALGYDVEWKSTERSISINHGKIKMNIDNREALIDNITMTLDVAPIIINGRTMVPLGIIAETLDCTVDWFGTNRMVLINKRGSDGNEKSVFERYKQSDLFWEYSTPDADCLVWKTDYATQAEASSPAAFHDWWIETPTDRSTLENQSLDCTILMHRFEKDDLASVRDILYTPYPTGSGEAYDLMMKSIKGEIWETFYPVTSEWYPLYSAMGTFSGTFGTHYLDNREVQMSCNSTCTLFYINISDEWYVNPEIPREVSQDEIDFYTNEAKNSYCLGLWGLK